MLFNFFCPCLLMQALFCVFSKFVLLFIPHTCFPVVSFVFGVSRVVCAVCIVCPHTLIVPKLSPFIRQAARAEYLILNNMEHISFVFQQIQQKRWRVKVCAFGIFFYVMVLLPTQKDYQQFFHKSQLQRNKIGFATPLLHPFQIICSINSSQENIFSCGCFN